MHSPTSSISTTLDFKEWVTPNSGVILHIAWWKKDPKTNTWKEGGSRSINAYEIDSENSKLKITDPGTDYSNRKNGFMYDDVEYKQTTELEIQKKLGKESIELISEKWDPTKRRAIIKNIYAFTPTKTE